MEEREEGAGRRGGYHLKHFKLVNRVPLVLRCCGSRLRSMINTSMLL